LAPESLLSVVDAETGGREFNHTTLPRHRSTTRNEITSRWSASPFGRLSRSIGLERVLRARNCGMSENMVDIKGYI